MVLTYDQIFRISIYFAGEDTSKGENHGSEGANKRVFYHKGHMKLRSLVDSLMMGRCGEEMEDERTNQTDRERGKMLVTGKSLARNADPSAYWYKFRPMKM